MDAHCMLLDWNGLELTPPPSNEDFLDFSNLQFSPSTSGFGDINLNHGKSDEFLDWMDEKMDLSILDELEGHSGLPYDLDAMVEDPVALLDNLMDWSPELSDHEFNLKSEKKGALNNNNSIMTTLSASPPESPGGKVPDIGFALSPDNQNKSLYVGYSNSNSPSEVSSTTNLDDINPCEFLKIEITSPAHSELPTSNPSSPNVSVLNNEIYVDLVGNTIKVETKSEEVQSALYKSDELSKETSDDVIDIKIDSPLKEEKEIDSDDKATHREIQVLEKISVPKRRSRGRKRLISSVDVPIEDYRREQKRVQNKVAATRYREKKRKETEAFTEEVVVLEKHNQELKNKVQQISTEISYLKGLLKEAKLRMESKK